MARGDTRARVFGSGKNFFMVWWDSAEQGVKGACEKGGGLKFRKKEKYKIKPLLVDTRRRGGQMKGALARAFSARATSWDLIGRSADGHLSNGRSRPVNAGWVTPHTKKPMPGSTSNPLLLLSPSLAPSLSLLFLALFRESHPLLFRALVPFPSQFSVPISVQTLFNRYLSLSVFLTRSDLFSVILYFNFI